MSELETNEIERNLERDRMALAQSLVALRERLRPANLVAEGREALMEKASPMISRVDGAVREHPVMTAVAGLALAGVIFGRHRFENGSDDGASRVSGTRFEALTRWEGEGGPPSNEPVDPEEEWLTEARGLRERARKMLRQIDDAARRGLAPAAQLAKHRAEVVSALAIETKAAMGKGLETLSGSARDQALQARERLFMGRIAVAEKSREAMEESPLMVGAALALAGAAAAYLFPPTETEDRLMGETRDQLASEVKAMLGREARKASAFGATLGDALKTDLRNAAGFAAPSDPVVRPIRH